MKNILSITFLFLVQLSIFGQCSPTMDGSIDCQAPVKICGPDYRYTYNENSLGAICSPVNKVLWHTFYNDGSDLILNFDDNLSQSAPIELRLYGPFTDLNSNICTDIENGITAPSQIIPMGVNNPNVNIAIGITTGYYLLGAVDDDCSGCFTITVTQGELPCIWCAENTLCDYAIDVSAGYCFTHDCSACGTSLTGASLYYTFTSTVDNSILNYLESFNQFAPASFATFDYTIYELPNGDPCASVSNLTVLTSGNDVNGISEVIPTIGTYMIVINGLGEYCIESCFSLSEPLDICETCIGSFAPVPGQPYLIGAWVKQEGTPIGTTTYIEPEVYINYTLSGGGTGQSGPFKAEGAIIDGWQRIEAEFDIPSNAVDIEIELTCTSGSALFDDIRVFPFNASMKTFVYDPVNMRLAAELDERHYATFYEYDEEGKLVRIKKETEKGVMTIQETKSNASKSQ